MQTKELSFSELVETAVKLNLKDFEAFLLSVNTRRAQLRPDVLSKKESDLMKKIYLVFPEEKKNRVALLNSKIWDETLTEKERTELLHLIEEQEKWAGERMDYISKLAALRNVDYVELMKQLGILPSSQDE